MSWQSDYTQKLTTADEALRAVQSDMRVYVHGNSAYPQVLLEALTRRAPQLRNVEMMHVLGFGDGIYNRPEFADSFRHNALFIGANMRETVRDGRADYMPIHLSEIEALFSSRQVEIDVALIQVAPPDRHGFCSLGVAVETTLTATRMARVVIAQVNNQMPRTFGDTCLHVREIDMFVEGSRPLPEAPRAETLPEHHEIARHVSEMIEDGSCVQTGIGAIPDAILPFLINRRDLGIHSETLCEGAIPLIEAGVITGARKQINRNKIVLGFAMGSRKWYDYIDDNPLFEFQPNSYTNDPYIIAQNDNVVAINSAVEVDITGQVVSDSIGQVFISGFGGQLDFIRGAARSRGGKPIIALTSTAKGGSISRIVPMITPGAGVVTTRADVHYVATEYGVAELHGKNIRQRVEALIRIAHPKFRDELTAYCQKLGWIPRPIAVTGEVINVSAGAR